MRQSTQSPAPVIDEELLRLTDEVQETVEGLGEALTKRADQLRALIAEADRRIEALHGSSPIGAAEPAVLPPTPAPEVAQVPEPAVQPPAEARQAGEPAPSGRRASVAEVRRLAAEGHDPDTIARLTNRGREEIRLLLATGT